MENERKIKRERTKEKRKEERGRERKIIMIFFFTPPGIYLSISVETKCVESIATSLNTEHVEADYTL